MKKILFICHGNICRSPMAEFVMKDLVSKAGLAGRFTIASAATSREEIGNPVHPGTRKKLSESGILTDGKYAIQLKKEDYRQYDYLIGMDSWNIKNILRIVGSDPEKKVYKLLDFALEHGDIADPWYTGDFETTYQEVVSGCTGLLKQIVNENYFTSSSTSLGSAISE